MTDPMLEQLRAYRQKKAELEELKRCGQEYVESVRRAVESDLIPLEEEIQRLKTSMHTFLIEENDGEKYKVPGLGTAYLTKRIRAVIEDEETFLEAYAERTGGTDNLYDRKLNSSKVKQAADGFLQEYGESLPGTIVERQETLTVRFSAAAGSGGGT